MPNFHEEKIVNVNDLANGYYNHLPKVSEYDMYDVLDWLSRFGIPEDSGFWTGKGTDPVTNEEKYLPTQILWKNGDKELLLDAALVYNFPHVSRVELLNFFNLPGADKLVMYDGSREPIAYTKFKPIGNPWPEQGANAYRPADGDNLPPGSLYTSPYGQTFRKERRQIAFYSFYVWVALPAF